MASRGRASSSSEDQHALWGMLTGAGKLAFRKSPVGIIVEVPGRERTSSRQGTGTVTIRGPVGEVLLASYGRARAAEIELDGVRMTSPGSAARSLRSSSERHAATVGTPRTG